MRKDKVVYTISHRECIVYLNWDGSITLCASDSEESGFDEITFDSDLVGTMTKKTVSNENEWE